MNNYCSYCDYLAKDNYRLQKHINTPKHAKNVENHTNIDTEKKLKKEMTRKNNVGDVLLKKNIITLEKQNKVSEEKYKKIIESYEEKIKNLVIKHEEIIKNLIIKHEEKIKNLIKIHEHLENENDELKNENDELKNKNNELKNKIHLLEINLNQEKDEKCKLLMNMLLEIKKEKNEKGEILEKILLESNKEKEEKNKLLDKLITQKTDNDNKQCTINILNNYNCNVDPLQNLDFFDILDKHILKTSKINPNNLPTKKCLGYDCDGDCDKKYVCPSKYVVQKKMINQWLKTKETNACSDYISDALINYYSENTDTNLLPIINTDSSRNTYYLRIRDNETDEDKWISDKKGKKLTEMVIKPFIEYIIVLLNEYNEHLTNNMITNATTLVSNLILHFENELSKLKQDKPTSKKLLIEYKRQKTIYLEYLNTFKNYESNDALMKDIGYILDICVAHCNALHSRYDRNNMIITSGKNVVADIIKCLNKTAFINTILSKISAHFYKSHNSILKIIK